MNNILEIRQARVKVMPGFANSPAAIAETAQELGTENYDMNGVIRDYVAAVKRLAPEGLSAVGDSVVVDFDLLDGGRVSAPAPADVDDDPKRYGAWEKARQDAVERGLAEWRRRVDEMGTTFAFNKNFRR